MKIDKWTLGLAAAGLVSLPGVSQAEEKPNQVLTAVANTSISGYVDTSAHWNPGTGNANSPRYKFNGPSKSDGFNLNTVQLRIERPPDESEWAAGYRADLWFGPDANVLGTTSLGGDTSDFAIRQAYVALRTPVGNGIDWKVGVFDAIIGFESVEGPSNPNYTRSYGHSIEPQTHTGVLASYHFNEYVSLSAGVANTVGPVINERAHGPNLFSASGPKAESSKTYMGSIVLTAPDDWAFIGGSTLYGGIVNGFSSSYGENQTSLYAGGTLNTPVEGLKLGAAFDYLDIHNYPSGIGNSGEAWAASGYVSFQVTEKLSVHGRVEYLSDKAYFFYGDFPRTKILAVTGTLQYDLWENVLSRLEVRWDHQLSGLDGHRLFGGRFDDEDGGRKKNDVLVAANIVYRF